MYWSGKIVSNLQRKISYLLDADLSHDIAKALRCLDFDIIHTDEVPEFQDHLDHLEDPEIITHCKDNTRTWITHDFESHRKHIEAIKLARINVVWVRVTTKFNEAIPDETATWRIFKTIVKTINEIRHRIQNSQGAIHFRINQKSSSPTIDWAESGLDRPKGR